MLLKWLLRGIGGFFLLLLIALVGLNIWGRATLGTYQPAADAARDPTANRAISGCIGTLYMPNPLVAQ